jgi:environmental stress-induced protein Ves
VRVIRASSYRRVAWNNGGGTTADIDVVQLGGAFAWRLSVADIERDGPFSDFTGCDRTIVLTDGRGFALDDGVTVAVLDRPSAVHRFDGGRVPMCRLLDGPARAFNVMSARVTHRHDVTVAALTEPLRVAPDAVLYVVMLRGGASVHAEPATHAGLDVPAGDTLRACAVPVAIRPTTGHAVAAVVRIRPRPV